MENRFDLVLNVATAGGFVAYAAGIYLQVTRQGIRWGNVAVDLAIRTVGVAAGCVVVVLVGVAILGVSLALDRLRGVNVFLCWFWIFSLYQCALNSFLQLGGFPDEPVNASLKYLFPTMWYPVKEALFTLASAGLTLLWDRRVWGDSRHLNRVDAVLVVVLGVALVGATLASQLTLLN
ncbi:MAG: hypothetical protein ACTSU5_11845 [Promethearchaeota archaeon]